MRGSLGSLLTISINIGMLLGFMIGSYIPYTYQPIVALSVPIFFNVLFFRFPNTPQFLLKTGQVEVIDIKKNTEISNIHGFTFRQQKNR